MTIRPRRRLIQLIYNALLGVSVHDVTAVSLNRCDRI